MAKYLTNYYLNAGDIEAAMRIIEGSAQSMGLQVVE